MHLKCKSENLYKKNKSVKPAISREAIKKAVYLQYIFLNANDNPTIQFINIKKIMQQKIKFIKEHNFSHIIKQKEFCQSKTEYK